LQAGKAWSGHRQIDSGVHPVQALVLGVKPGHLRLFVGPAPRAGLEPILGPFRMLASDRLPPFSRSQPTLSACRRGGGLLAWLMVGYFKIPRTPARPLRVPLSAHARRTHTTRTPLAHTFRSVAQQELEPPAQSPAGPPLHSEPAPDGPTSSGDKSLAMQHTAVNTRIARTGRLCFRPPAARN
jgi:hypothetical protein